MSLRLFTLEATTEWELILMLSDSFVLAKCCLSTVESSVPQSLVSFLLVFLFFCNLCCHPNPWYKKHFRFSRSTSLRLETWVNRRITCLLQYCLFVCCTHFDLILNWLDAKNCSSHSLPVRQVFCCQRWYDSTEFIFGQFHLVSCSPSVNIWLTVLVWSCRQFPFPPSSSLFIFFYFTCPLFFSSCLLLSFLYQQPILFLGP